MYHLFQLSNNNFNLPTNNNNSQINQDDRSMWNPITLSSKYVL